MRRKKPLKSSGFKKKALGDTHSPGKEPGARKHADDTTGTSTGRTGAKNNASGKKKAPPKPKANKKPSLRTMTARADTVARKACHARGSCEAAFFKKCKPTERGCTPQLQWCHILSRRHKTLRWDPDNCICMCAGCHWYFTQEPDEFYRMIEELWPGRWDLLRSRLLTQTVDAQFWIDHYRSLDGR